uniref:Zinc-finger domain-containing protein n=1 Tax=Glossina brevipalpis TaxID=37001 RepID=A0A1A9WN99_9MUSC
MIRHREKNPKNYIGYHTDIENEPEEGEIVDNYELISSDEEFVMRQRIEELEAKNKEIEQIAVISSSYANEYHYAKLQSCNYNNYLNKDYWRKRKNEIGARLSKDVSSVSSVEYEMSRKSSKRHRSRGGKKKTNHHNRCRNHSKRRKRHCRHACSNESGRHKRRREFNYSMEAIDLHTESSDSLQSVTYVNEGTIDSPNQIDRDSLRFAVTRSIHNSHLKEETMGSLSKRLLKQPKKENTDDEDIIIVENDDDPQIQTIEEDTSDSLEEKELRLIALKSAVLKKHMDRKKRNAELAYSPTDFDDMLKFNVIENDIKSDIEVDLEDSQTPELISSPLASPKLLLSPQYIDDDSRQQMVDTKPVDMDIASSSDSEHGEVLNEFRPVVQQQQPSPLCTLPIASNDLSFGIKHQDYPFSLYVPGLKMEPLPPGVEYYEELVPPPPPFHQENFSVQEMEVEDQENAENDNRIETDKNPRIIEQNLETKELSSCEEEEELALRALLLAKFQSPRNKKRKLEEESKDIANLNSKNDTNEILKTNISSEWILKEAVRRFKLSTHIRRDSNETDDGKTLKFAENSMNMLDNLEPVQTQHKEEKVIIESFGDDESNSNLLENEVTQEKIKTKDMQCGKKGDWEETQSCKASDRDVQISSYTNLQINLQPVEETINLVENKNSTQNMGDSLGVSEEYRRYEEIETNKSADPLNEKILKDNSNVDLNVTAIVERHLTKAFKGSCEENIRVDINSQETLNSTEIQERDVDQIAETCAHVKVKKNCSVNETSIEFSKETKSLEKSMVMDISSKPPSLGTEKCKENFKLLVKSSNDSSDRTQKSKIFKEDTNSPAKTEILNPTIRKSAFANISSKTNQDMKAMSSEMRPHQLSAKVIQKNLTKKYQNRLKVVNKASSTTLTTLRTQQGTILPTYSVLKTTKIVKPNKVINRNVDIKPIKNNINLLDIEHEISSTPITSQVVQTRLITSKEQVKSMCQVPKLVINLKRSSSSTDTSASEDGNDIIDDYDYLCRPSEDYNDNASPISLIMESPHSRTPNRSNSPTEKCPEKSRQQFEEKLDSFLKSVRSKVQEQVVSLQKTPQAKTIMENEEAKANNNTPVAVRHLPVAAQEEYRRLIHRMKLLEAQRKSSNTDTEISDLFTSKDDDLNALSNAAASTATSVSLNQSSLCKQVLIKNASSNAKPSTGDAQKSSKSSVLTSYENMFTKIGAGIITHLDKSLNLIEEAKKAKLSKLNVEKRLKALKAEIDLLQIQHREEQHKISKIYPNICKTNDVITTLKQKRTKVFKLAVNLGKALKGENYRLNNDLKQNITEKSKQLAEEIKLVNSLKLQNIDKFTAPTEDTKNHDDANEGLLTPANNDREQSLQVPTATFQEGDIREFQEKNSTQENETLQEEVENVDHQDKESLAANHYVSPLNNLSSENSDLDPQGVLCPYDLMGHCEDKNCSYVHLSENLKV